MHATNIAKRAKGNTPVSCVSCHAAGAVHAAVSDAAGLLPGRHNPCGGRRGAGRWPALVPVRQHKGPCRAGRGRRQAAVLPAAARHSDGRGAQKAALARGHALARAGGAGRPRAQLDSLGLLRCDRLGCAVLLHAAAVLSLAEDAAALSAREADRNGEFPVSSGRRARRLGDFEPRRTGAAGFGADLARAAPMPA